MTSRLLSLLLKARMKQAVTQRPPSPAHRINMEKKTQNQFKANFKKAQSQTKSSLKTTGLPTPFLTTREDFRRFGTFGLILIWETEISNIIAIDAYTFNIRRRQFRHISCFRNVDDE